MSASEFTNAEIANEIWRPVVGYEGIYEVSSLGRIRVLKIGSRCRVKSKEGILVTRARKNRYRVAYLRREGKGKCCYVHALAAAAFRGQRPRSTTVNHIDGDKSNNREVNLEYITQKENMRHAVRMGLMPTGHRHGTRTHPESYRTADGGFVSAKLSPNDVIEIRRALLSHERPQFIALRFRITRMAVSSIKLGKSWSHIEELRAEVRQLLGDSWKRGNRTNLPRRPRQP